MMIHPHAWPRQLPRHCRGTGWAPQSTRAKTQAGVSPALTHRASCSLTANQHASEAVICCDRNGNPVESLSSVGQCCSSRSKLVEQQGKELAAAAALLGSSGCTLQQRRQDSPRAPILRVMKHKRQSGAMRSPALASYIALHQIRRAVSNSSYLPPTPPLLLFMDIELTLSCLRELCI